MLPQDPAVDQQVKQKCRVLFIQWANAHKNTAGLERIAGLYKELPNTKRPAAAPTHSKVLRETDPGNSDNEAGEDPFAGAPPPQPQSSSSNVPQTTATSAPLSRPVALGSTKSSSLSSKFHRSKKESSGGAKPFNLAKEKDNMTNAIAQASIASTNLLNGLQLINRETERISENAEVVRRFETCKTLRRQVLQYIQHVESEKWIGSLVNANDELVKALTAYEIMDKSVDDDSDSDAASEALNSSRDHASQNVGGNGVMASTASQLAGLSLEPAPAKPPRPRPTSIPMPPQPSFVPQEPSLGEDEEEQDEDDPFGDSHLAPTPAAERPGMTWREV